MNSCTKDKVESWTKPLTPSSEDSPNDKSNSAFNSSGDNSSHEDKNSIGRSLSKRKFLAGEQWSQEENCFPEELCPELLASRTPNGHSSSPNQKEESSTSILSACSKQCFTHNNNLVIDKTNLRCSDEKSCCFYMKFPLKVNNNVYPEKSLNLKDGMEDYFQQHSSTTPNNKSSLNGSASVDPSPIISYNNDHYSSDNKENGSPSYPDQINALNGEEVDEDDGCIYTYKGDNYEANLSHLLETCFSCGLPTTETSGTQYGAVSIQRILNGSPHPNPQSNLYSPEMDFLEMDFDPGSNGDGGDSDCEDNNSILNVEKPSENDSLENFNKLESNMDKKPNNIPKEIRSLMCRRCEMCIYNDHKVNNTTNNFLQKPKTDPKNLQSSLDDRPSLSKSFKEPHNQKEHLNVKLDTLSDRNIENIENCYSNLPATFSSSPSHFPLRNFPKSEPNLVSNQRVENTNLINNQRVENTNLINNQGFENNLNAACDGEYSEDFSDGGDEADDEGGDDSTSEHPPLEANGEVRRVSSSSLFFPSPEGEPTKTSCQTTSNDFKTSSSPPKTNKHLRFSSENSYAKFSNSLKFLDDTKTSSTYGVSSSDHLTGATGENSPTKIASETNTENNNLGSISAPEVSPSKEYSPLEKFSRSISFHNQLSSPKYENVCFSNHYKDNFLASINKYQSPSCNSFEYCNCKHGNSFCKSLQGSEVTNLEACVDRLSQREKSVFNIGTNSSHTPQHTGSSSKLSNSSAQSLENQTVNNYTQESCNSAHSSSMTFSHSTVHQAENNDEQKPTEEVIPLPVKVIQHKVDDDPSKDPNTASKAPESVDQSLIVEKNTQIEKVMIWTERQAIFRQVSQVGTSACGATAVINVLLALDHSRPVKTVMSEIKTRLRAENAPLVEYLLSRFNAGTTHEDLIKGVETISEGTVTGRFFHMFPKRAFQFSRWLIHWIKKGGVPVATLNLQVGVPPGQTVPDAWHHQMVFGVGPQGIYLTNPLECVSDSLLSDQLCSDSVLLVRRTDIESRWDNNDKLIQLSLQSDPRWNDMNVLGQVVCVLKEQAAPEMLQGRRHLTSHVAIPASYQSGVSIFVRSDNPCLQELLDAAELPFLDDSKNSFGQ